MSQTARPAAGSIEVFAPAKINLWLHVVGRRADGYHLIDSLVAFADVGDSLTATPADGLSLGTDGPFAAALPPQSDNLVLRAARLLAEAGGIAPHARIGLTKRLPIASGLGGGSADAAAALQALGRLWRIEIDCTAMGNLALRLGADVPVCLAGRPCHVGGVGEILAPAPGLPAVDLVLVNPGVALHTSAVFAAVARGSAPPTTIRPWSDPPADAAALAALLAHTRNDLTEAAAGLCPAVGDVLGRLADQPGCLMARMSGSGATCFGIFADRGHAVRAQEAIRTARPDWWVMQTMLRRPER